MLVSTEPGGLGNRIKSWVSAMRLDPAARVYWPRLPNMPAEFSDLFVNDCGIDGVPAGAVEHCSWRLAVLPEDADELPPGFAAVVSGTNPLLRRAGRLAGRVLGRPDDRYRYMVTPKRFSGQTAPADGRSIDFEYGRIPDYFLRLYGRLFARVTMRPEILERVDTFAAAHLDDMVTGVQVRTWRDSPRRQRKHYRPAVRRLEALLAAADGKTRFLVVSDDDEVVPWLAKQLGGRRVIAFERETARRQSWQSRDGLIEDLVDMLLLSRCGDLIASYLSTFSETAWWLGGARARVSVF